MDPLAACCAAPQAGAALGLVLVYVFFAALGGAVFVGAPGWSSWLNTAAQVGIIALPVGMLMTSGDLDISVGSVVPAANLTLAILSGHYELPAFVGVAAALLVGLVNGLLVTRTTIPSLIVTIGTMFAVMRFTLGLTVMIAGSTGLFYVPDLLSKLLLGSAMGGMFQVAILWWTAFALVAWYLLHISPWGNWVFALGGSRESARNAGVATNRLTIQLYMLSGFAAAFVGVLQVMTFSSALVAAGHSFIFNSIMCVVIGGVVLNGGAGSVAGIFVGTITFAIVVQGIYFTQIDRNWSNLIIAVTLLLAVGMNESFRKLALSAGRKKPPKT